MNKKVELDRIEAMKNLTIAKIKKTTYSLDIINDCIKTYIALINLELKLEENNDIS